MLFEQFKADETSFLLANNALAAIKRNAASKLDHMEKLKADSDSKSDNCNIAWASFLIKVCNC